jgi:hypothetical protein
MQGLYAFATGGLDRAAAQLQTALQVCRHTVLVNTVASARASFLVEWATFKHMTLS